MSDDLSQIMGAIGGLKSSVDALVSGQNQLFDLTRESYSRTATLESKQADTERRMGTVETTQERHSNELAETRGANRANRWLVLTVPPGLVAIVEAVRAVFQHNPGGH